MPFVWFIAAIAILWLWLTGHWFGRVLAFIAFSVLAWALNEALPPYTDASAKVSFAVLALGAAWLVASIPRWHRLRSARLSVLF